MGYTAFLDRQLPRLHTYKMHKLYEKSKAMQEAKIGTGCGKGRGVV